uniref:Uncharacterized protein n=1 Tax=viral metagenome TaxID=1070528 RepID=A0A6M3J5K7_9ZZZZ
MITIKSAIKSSMEQNQATGSTPSNKPKMGGLFKNKKVLVIGGIALLVIAGYFIFMRKGGGSGSTEVADGSTVNMQ